jgi:hypothetical protein
MTKIDSFLAEYLQCTGQLFFSFFDHEQLIEELVLLLQCTRRDVIMTSIFISMKVFHLELMTIFIASLTTSI